MAFSAWQTYVQNFGSSDSLTVWTWNKLFSVPQFSRLLSGANEVDLVYLFICLYLLIYLCL